MSDIKSIIERLCKLLARIGITEATAETVRKAKFDKASSVKPFWIILAELFALKELNWKLTDNTWKSAVDRLDSGGILVDYVKENFIKLGYTKTTFYNLPPTQTAGSRELLIAFAWLLSTFDPLQWLLASSLDQDINMKYLEHLQISQSSLVRKPSLGFSPFVSTNGYSDHEKLERIIWLLGKLRLASRQLLQVQHEELRLFSKFQLLSTDNIQMQDACLSKLHLHLLLQPEFLEKYLQIIQQETMLIKLYAKWKEIEDNFWKWMVTVVDLNEQNFSTTEEDEASLLLSICRATCKKQLDEMEQHQNHIQPRFVKTLMVSDRGHVSQECKRLQQHQEQLLKNLLHRRETCRTTLETLSESFPGITCLKPLS